MSKLLQDIKLEASSAKKDNWISYEDVTLLYFLQTGNILYIRDWFMFHTLIHANVKDDNGTITLTGRDSHHYVKIQFCMADTKTVQTRTETMQTQISIKNMDTGKGKTDVFTFLKSDLRRAVITILDWLEYRPPRNPKKWSLDRDSWQLYLKELNENKGNMSN